MLTVTSKDNTTIAYDKTGQGPLLILIGGAFNTRSFGPNESLVPLLTNDFTVINYDRRGRGGSSDTLPYAVEREIEDIEALIDANGGSAYLYGISSGAALALKATSTLHDKVGRLALFEAPFVVDSTRKPVPSNFAAHLTELIQANKPGAAIQYFMTKGVGLPTIFVYMMRLMPAWAKLKAVAPTVPYDAICLGDNASGQPLNGIQWSKATMPTLVISGGKSPTWMQNAMLALATTLPNASHRTLAGQMHIVQATALAPMLLQFFKGL